MFIVFSCYSRCKDKHCFSKFPNFSSKKTSKRRNFFFRLYFKLITKFIKVKNFFNTMSLKRGERNFLLVEIGNRIKEFRSFKQLTQVEFAKEMGIDYKNLPKIEKGERGLTETMLYNLIIYFPDFDPIYILTGRKKELETTPTEGG